MAPTLAGVPGPPDGEQDVSIGRTGTKPCSTVRFVKKDCSGVSLRYGYIDSFPFDGRSRIEVLHARWTVTITGWGLERLHAYLEDDKARVVREGDDRLRQGEEGVTTIDTKGGKG
jgi:hypothetical protein